MADPLSITTGIVALVTFAFQASVSLSTAVRSFQSRDRSVRGLRDELIALTVALESLLETVDNNPEIDFDALKLPIQRCGKACEEYEALIARCSKHSTESRSSARDWVTQKYLQGDIDDFRDMLAVYKSTINIAIANVQLRIVTLTPKVLEDYKVILSETKDDLQSHLQQLEDKVNKLAAGEAPGDNNGDDEWLAMLEEKESTQQGLVICAQLSAQIDRLEPTSKEHPKFAERQSARKYVKSHLGTAKGSVQSLASRLQSHLDEITRQMATMQSTAPLSENTAVELERLHETEQSIRQCINVVSEANETLITEKRNIIEDVTLEDNSYNFSISTIGALFTTRGVKLTGQSRQVTGQIDNKSYQTTITALTQLDMANGQSSQDPGKNTTTPEPENQGSSGTKFQGRGFKLPAARESL